MIWTITIATFLGSVVAVLLMLFIFYRREQIGKVLREQWTEGKTDSGGGRATPPRA